MTAFQLLVEMPLTGRDESYAPANFAEKVLPIRPKSERARRALNYAGHMSIGVTWGATHALISRGASLQGQRAIATTFGAVYVGDALLNTALGLYKPWRWSAQDWAVDIGDKLVLAEATGLIFDRLSP